MLGSSERNEKFGYSSNLTTNGILVDDYAVEQIKKYCGGVAVSIYDHTEKYWRRAIALLSEAKIKLNLHFIISDKNSIEKLRIYYQEFVQEKNIVDYAVILPFMNVGFGAKNPKTINYPSLTEFLDEVYRDGHIAFGANFYSFLQKNNDKYNLSLYPLEIFSKYLVLNDKMEVFNNSFSRKIVPFNHQDGCALGFARTDFSLE